MPDDETPQPTLAPERPEDGTHPVVPRAPADPDDPAADAVDLDEPLNPA